MTPTCYTTKEELALMERQGMGLMYDRLRGDEAIALYSEGRVRPLIADLLTALKLARSEAVGWFDEDRKSTRLNSSHT